jgi:hypothetical protein
MRFFLTINVITDEVCAATANVCSVSIIEGGAFLHANISRPYAGLLM